jgi:hypothetical protein
MEFHVSPNTPPLRMTNWLEQVLLARYLDRQLTGKEAAWFEAYALDKPELLAMIEADTRLRDALATGAPAHPTEERVERVGRRGGATNEAIANGNEAVQARQSSSAGAQGRAHSRMWLAMAAALVLGLGTGFLGTRALRDGGSIPAVVASPTHIVYDTMRGEATPPRIEHAGSASAYVLVEVAVPPGAEHIVLNVENAAEQILTPSPDGFVSFLMERKAATGGHKATLSYALDNRTQKRSIDIDATNRGTQ